MPATRKTRTQVLTWANELIDLSKRNTSLFFRPLLRGTLEIRSPAPVDVLRRLQDNQEWRLFAPLRHQPGEAAWTVHDSLTLARPGDLVTERVSAADLQATLRNLARLADLDLADRGLESLYLCFGMLHWQREEDDDESRSPLLFLPVRLVRASPRDPYRLRRTDGDALLNRSLQVLLEQEYQLELPTVDAGHVQDVDLPALLDSVAAAVRRRGWRVEPTVVLKRATFHKEAMFRDLTENLDAVSAHPMVAALADPSAALPQAAVPPEEHELDRVAPPERARLILDADASQRRAVVAALRGVSFVMDGPPGTGKSQTIANMIAELIAAGRSVLFVSEKLPALQVVSARLRGRGLDPFLLELHGQKVGRKEVAERLGQALRFRPLPDPRLTEADLANAARLRERLTGYAHALNERRSPLELSVEEVVGRLAQLHGLPLAPFPSSVDASLSADRLAELRDDFKRLARVWAPVERRETFVWRGLRPDESAPHARQELERLLEQLRRGLEHVDQLAEQLAEETSLHAPRGLGEAEWLVDVLDEVAAQPPTERSWWTTAPPVDFEAELDALEVQIAAQEEDVAHLLDAYGDDWPALDHDAARRWEELIDSLRSELLPAAGLGASIVQLEAQVAALEHTTALAGQLQQEVPGIAEALRAPVRDRILAECYDLAVVAAHADALIRPDDRWAAVTVLEQVDGALGVLKPLVDEYRQRRTALSDVFIPEVEQLDLAGLVTRFAETHRGLRKLGGSYRRDKATVAAVARSGKAAKAVRERLPEALELQRLGRSLDDAHERARPVLGGFARQRDTDVDAAAQALAVLRDAVRRLRDDYDSAGIAAQLAGDRPADATLGTRGARGRLRIDEWRVRSAPALFGGGAVPAMALGDLARDAELALGATTALLDLVRTTAAGRRRAADVPQLLADLVRRRSIWERERQLVEREKQHRRLAGRFYDGFATDVAAVRTGRCWAATLQRLYQTRLPATAAQQLHEREPAADPDALRSACEHAQKVLADLLSRFEEPRSEELGEEFDASFPDCAKLLRSLVDEVDQIEVWRIHISLTERLRQEGWHAALDFCTAERIRAADLPGVLERALLAAWFDSVAHADTALRDSRADDLSAAVSEFRAADRAVVRDASQRVAAACAARRPVTSVGQAKIIEKEAQKRRRHMPVRVLLQQTADVTTALKPCFLMSPLSVSEFLPSDFRFDVVVFDEASQVTPADAVNCVYRADQLIVAGDDRQLPPTSFFERVGCDDDDAYDEEQLDDFESVLGLCKGTAQLHSIRLRWHYRSQHEALIDFSNRRFYDSGLVTFPGAVGAGAALGVSLSVLDGVYRGGTHRDNPIEADAVAARVLEHAELDPDCSLGVVTFSQAQAEAVEAAIDRRRLDRPVLDPYFSAERPERFFVKALENVQGDERDLILFSVGYGPREDGSISANFGPLNRKGGERRLNVAVTRARRRVEVFASFHPERLAGKAKASGLMRLLDYLRYARELQSGGSSIGGVPAADEALARSVAATLEGWGYEVDEGVGMSSYRLDLGVRHPERDDEYLLGIELDGSMYDSSAVARDRERLRHDVLGRLGWQLHRVWGPAWYQDRGGSERRLRAALDAALAPPAPREARLDTEVIELRTEQVNLDSAPTWTTPYVPCWPEVDARVHPAEPEAMGGLIAAIAQVVRAEAPIVVNLLVQRLAWQYGVNGTKRVSAAVGHGLTTLERRGELRREGEAVFTDRQVQVRIPLDDEDSRRTIDQITRMELSTAVEHLLLDARAASEEELLVRVARLFGFGRVGGKIRDALGQVIEDLVADGRAARSIDGTLRAPQQGLREPVHDPAAALEELIGEGEGPRLELKSSLRYDLEARIVHKELERAVVKTVAGFMNADGGTLLVGVADDGAVLGLDGDYSLLAKKGTRDGFELHLSQLLAKTIGEAALAFVAVSFVDVRGADVCRVDVRPSPEPVYLDEGGGRTFVARLGNATRPLPVDEAHRYIRNRWG